MIATILPSSSNFHAIEYNERKVAQGTATLLEMTNVYGVADFGPYTPAELQKYFIDYSARNDRIRKPQFHVAISCKGHEYTPEQLRIFAHRYLERMGYGSEEQPLVIYAHYDTDNTHIHIVTSRVAPDGHKIDHSHERRRSQRVLNELMQIDPGQQMEKDLGAARQYDFVSAGQFTSVLKAMGYDALIDHEAGCIPVFKYGVSLARVPVEEIETLAKGNGDKREKGQKGQLPPREKRRRQVKAIFRKYHGLAVDLEDFRQTVHKRFGMDVILHGSTGSPFGFTVIDHSAKRVFVGKEIMDIKQLLDFPSRENRRQLALEIIGRQLGRDRFAGTWELNKSIARKMSGVYIKGKKLYLEKECCVDLPEEMAEIIHRNNRMEYAAGYAPANREERLILESVFRSDYGGLFGEFLNEKCPEGMKSKEIRTGLFMEIVSGSASKAEVWQQLRQQGFSMRRSANGDYFVVDHRAKAIVNVESVHPGLSQHIGRKNHRMKTEGAGGIGHGMSQHGTKGIPSMPSGFSEASHSHAREWEVGNNRVMDDPDMRQKL